jgi:hypothetical protein
LQLSEPASKGNLFFNGNSQSVTVHEQVEIWELSVWL